MFDMSVDRVAHLPSVLHNFGMYATIRQSPSVHKIHQVAAIAQAESAYPFSPIKQSLRHSLPAEEPDVDFLQWLGSTVAEAAKSAEKHDVLRVASEDLTATIENQFKLSHVLVSCSTSLLTL